MIKEGLNLKQVSILLGIGLLGFGMGCLLNHLSFYLCKEEPSLSNKKEKTSFVIRGLLAAIVYLLVFMRYQWTLGMVQYLILWSIGLCISFSDLRCFLIPDVLIILGILNRIVFLIGNSSFFECVESLLHGLCIVLPLWLLVRVMERIKGREMMGRGDLKLYFMLGLYTSIYEGIFALMLSCAIGILFGFLFNKGIRDQEFPFGPSILIAYFLVMILG